MSLKAILVDDEKMARILLAGMLAEFCPDVELITQASDLPEAVKLINKHRPDVVFLDIEMPGHSGLEIADFFEDGKIPCAIVFTTAYQQYAIQAFKLSAIDYLLKPIAPEELEATVKRLRERKQLLNPEQLNLVRYGSNELQRRIAIPTQSSIRFLTLEEISHFKADGAYTEVILKQGERVIASKGLKHFEEAVADFSHFVRCHKSYIVNLQHIKELVKGDAGYLLMANGTQVSYASERQGELLKRLTY